MAPQQAPAPLSGMCWWFHWRSLLCSCCCCWWNYWHLIDVTAAPWSSKGVQVELSALPGFMELPEPWLCTLWGQAGLSHCPRSLASAHSWAEVAKQMFGLSPFKPASQGSTEIKISCFAGESSAPSPSSLFYFTGPGVSLSSWGSSAALPVLSHDSRGCGLAELTFLQSAGALLEHRAALHSPGLPGWPGGGGSCQHIPMGWEPTA